MSNKTSLPPITFKNELSSEVTVYDSFNKNNDKTSYLGTLTQLGTVKANDSAEITPIHTCSVFLVKRSHDGLPVLRVAWILNTSNTSISMTQSDLQAMLDSINFIQKITQASSPMSQAFRKIWHNKSLSSIALMTNVNHFFANTKDYKNCTFVTYMTALSYKASKQQKMLKTYSLCDLIKAFGKSCPSGMEDIAISVVAYKFELSQGALIVWFKMSLEKQAKSSAKFANLHSIVKQDSLSFKVTVDVLGNLSIICPLASSPAHSIGIPTGKNSSLKVYNPTLSLNISPIFKFIVVELYGDLKFSVFDKKIDAKISLTVDNVQANVAVEITGDHSSLPSPPGLKGVHLDEFGVEMGLFFEPPGFDFGIQGKFHLGDDNSVSVKDDTFGLVLNIEEEVVAPVYLSFYVDQLDLNKAIEIFTNSPSQISFPVSLSDLSFYWAPEPVALPDGTLANMGAGFSATVNIVNFVFYAKFEINFQVGISGLAEMSPLNWGEELKITGDGKGITQKVDAKGNTVKNNQIIKKTSAAKVQTIVPAGGPVLIISTSRSPYFHVNLIASLFKLNIFKINATIGNKGASLILDYPEGIPFFSIIMIDSFVRLAMTFDLNNYELNVQGIAGIVVPIKISDISPLAEAKVTLKANFIPDEGFLKINTQLASDSFILSKNCHLTGGLAFYIWFLGKHAGDFVQTIGGYNPKFNVPTFYPKIPRVGFNWRVDSNISLKGDAYYALCSHALMAGGSLEATWHSGSLKAWFTAAADFVIAWQPYNYSVAIYADIGVSYTYHFFGTHHIQAHVGADLSLWGPDFSGKAHVHLWIVSFTIKFGNAAPQKPQPNDWQTFKTSLLPADTSICTVSVTDGLVKEASKENTDLGIINPKDLSLVTNSVIPSKEAYSGNQKITTQGNDHFGIGSMALTESELSTTQTIIITKEGHDANEDFQYIPILKNVPVGLWGDSLTPTLNGNKTIKSTLAGFEIKPKTPPKSGETQAIDISQLKYTSTLIDKAYHWENFLTFQTDQLEEADRIKKIEKTIVSTQQTRAQLLKALGFTANNLTPSVAHQFLIAPQVGQLTQ